MDSCSKLAGNVQQALNTMTGSVPSRAGTSSQLGLGTTSSSSSEGLAVEAVLVVLGEGLQVGLV